jgi:hypothetical protein
MFIRQPVEEYGVHYYVACSNGDCGWKGELFECVHLKHSPELPLCPECYEPVEEE